MDFLEKHHLIHSWTGLFHTLVAFLAMGLGATVVLSRKGTLRHKRLGYAYAASMILMNLSAFGLYHLRGRVGIFHAFAVLSLVTVVMGVLSAMRRKRQDWLKHHYYWMNWSVVGLYCAFWAEVGTRLLDLKYFWWAVALATFSTAMAGSLIINRHARTLNLR